MKSHNEGNQTKDQQAFEKQGFTIIWFNPVLNDKDVETVVHALGLEE